MFKLESENNKLINIINQNRAKLPSQNSALADSINDREPSSKSQSLQEIVERIERLSNKKVEEALEFMFKVGQMTIIQVNKIMIQQSMKDSESLK